MTAKRPLAFVLTGGGARAAYQVGVLRSLARLCPDLEVSILTGVSAGGINTAFLAAGRHGFARCVDDLTELWLGLRPGSVFRVDAGSLGLGAARWIFRLASGGSRLAPQVRGLVDTDPLRKLLARALRVAEGGRGRIPGIRENLADGSLRAVGLSTVDWTTGRTVVWIQGDDVDSWERPQRRSELAELGIDHVMASAALPLLFPAVAIGQSWFGDGGVRLTSPLSPAIHLGARRILALSTRYRRSFAEADVPEVIGYPPPAQVAGVLLNSIFLDQLDQDALHLERINRLIADRPGQPDGPGQDPLGPIELALIRPSVDLGLLAGEYEPLLPRGLRFLTRGLGAREARGSDLISMLMFQRDYVERLIEIGEEDGDRQRPLLEALVCEASA